MYQLLPLLREHHHHPTLRSHRAFQNVEGCELGTQLFPWLHHPLTFNYTYRGLWGTLAVVAVLFGVSLVTKPPPPDKVEHTTIHWGDSREPFRGWSDWRLQWLGLALIPGPSTLIWDEQPEDLDLHLWIERGEGTEYHIFYGNRGSETEMPYAALIDDAQEGLGPENIAIYQNIGDGTYTFAVHHFVGEGTIDLASRSEKGKAYELT